MIFGEYHVAYPHLARHFEEAQISPTDANRHVLALAASVGSHGNPSCSSTAGCPACRLLVVTLRWKTHPSSPCALLAP
eukprot:scaffold7141_cov30-Tisochrysis_lutea.AAC.2